MVICELRENETRKVYAITYFEAKAKVNTKMACLTPQKNIDTNHETYTTEDIT